MPDVQYPDDSSPSSIRIEDLLATDDTPSPAPPAVREGLPRSFRMRADKHYVEMLDSPRPGDAKSSNSTSAVPAPSANETARATNDEPPGPSQGLHRSQEAAQNAEAVAAAVRAGSALEQSLSVLRTSTTLLANRGGLASSVAASLIRAEAWRATCLLQVSRFLRGEIAPTLKSVQASAVLEQVLDAVDAERRLRGISFERRINLGDGRIVTDEQLLVGALSGLLMAMISGSEAADAVVVVSAETRGHDVTFTFTARDENGDWACQLAGFTRVVSGIGGVAALPADSSSRVSVTFAAARSSG